MRLRPALATSLALAAVVTAAAAGVVAGAAPAYAVDNVCRDVDATTPPGETGRPSAPFALLGIEAAQGQVERFAPKADVPVRVAVLSSGVLPDVGAIPVKRAVDGSGVGGEITDPQGTEIAGLVAGSPRPDGQGVGIAPGAEIVDVRTFVNRGSNSARERPTTPALAGSISWVAANARPLNIKIAVVPYVVRKSDTLREVVKAAQDAGVIVVAAAGDRPEAGAEFSSSFEDPPANDEDAGPLFFPAGYPGVVAVNATGTKDSSPAIESVVKNSRTTVAAPTYDAVSYGLNGRTCLVQETSTGAAAAEVAGVLAMLWQHFPKEKPAQIVARLVNTADGTTDDPTPLTGAGVIQPYEALTRPLSPTRSGQVERTVVHADAETQAKAPEPATDLLAGTRDDAVWWGLIGGGLLLVALMLRPVLARRRRTS